MRKASVLFALLVMPALVWAQASGGPGSISILEVNSDERGGVGQGASASVAPGAPAPVLPRFVTGFNQAWWHNRYGGGWCSFDEAEATRLVKACHDNGARVLRVWLFEGLSPEGVVWDHDPRSRPGSTNRTVPTGIDERKLASIEKLLTIAESQGVLIYLTFFDGNIYSFKTDNFDRRKDEWWNVLNDKYGAGTGFLQNVVAPIMKIAARHRGAVFGVDLVNEFNALVKNWWFEDRWTGGLAFIRKWRTAIRSVADVPVGVSFGHHDAVTTMLDRRVPADAVDFYDFHVYDNSGAIPSAEKVRQFAASCGKPVYLGEFGQSSSAFDDALQVKTTEAFIENARSLGLAGAFAWRLSDIRPGFNGEARFSFEAFGKWRPAMETFKRQSAR
ncbi:MAG: hypothetical protein HY815_12625 [Candidatus Riflebacteria bacterium]|nr:hypothetical protein [Candidatus Riflebacteria bacterium]